VSEEIQNEQTGEEAPELTLDELFQEQVDQEGVEQAHKEMLLPQGTYTTEPPFTVTKLGKDKNGRPFARFFGKIVLGDKSGRIGVGLSWVRKNARVRDEATGELVESEKPDRSYKNYVMATKAYKIAYGEEAPNVGAIIAYLRDYPIRLRVIQTSDGENMVVSISAVRG
jgi:hypothetical protein